MSYKLMIKTHNITGLSYLCITSKDDYISYIGSGKYWKNHIKKYGPDIKTELIYESDDYNDFLVMCVKVSNELNVVNSDNFANLVPETGYNNYDGKPNVVLFWEYATDEMKREIISRRIATLKLTHWAYSTNSDDIKLKISEQLRQYWNDMTIEEKQQKRDIGIRSWRDMSLENKEASINALVNGCKKFHEDKTSEKYMRWKSSVSIGVKKYCNDNFDKISERNRNARLNTTDEAKQRRKEKIQNVYKSGKHDAMFERYSKERMGGANPYAKSIEIDGIIYGSVQEASRETGIAAHVLYKMRKDNEKNKIN